MIKLYKYVKLTHAQNLFWLVLQLFSDGAALCAEGWPAQRRLFKGFATSQKSSGYTAAPLMAVAYNRSGKRKHLSMARCALGAWISLQLNTKEVRLPEATAVATGRI